MREFNIPVSHGLAFQKFRISISNDMIHKTQTTCAQGQRGVQQCVLHMVLNRKKKKESATDTVQQNLQVLHIYVAARPDVKR